jgi:hypothetical protein
MLEPTNAASWRSYTDALRPPPGYTFDVGVGTTYGLTFPAMTAALLALVGGDDDATPDISSAVRAITRLGDRLRIFCDRGCIHLPEGKSADRLYALFDGLVVDVRVENASFHPKVWVLRFRSPSGAEPLRYRLVCTSRNLTESSLWELGTVIEGSEVSRGGVPAPLGKDVAGFVRALLSNAPRLPGAIAELPHGVERATFELGKEAKDGARFHWSKPGRPLGRTLPRSGRKVLVVSPFVRSTFLDVIAGFERVELVSSQSEFDGLSDTVYARLEGASAGLYVMRDDLVERAGEDESTDGAGEGAAGDSGATDLLRLEGLHAKLLVCDTEEGRVTLVGSANASAPAWGLFGAAGTTNWEAMLELRPGLPVTAFLDAFRDKRRELTGCIREYRRSARETSDGERIRELLADWSARIEGWELLMEHERAMLRLYADGDADVAVPPELSGGKAEVAPWLLAGLNDAFRPLSDVRAPGITYENVAPEDVCEFVVLRLEALGERRIRLLKVRWINTDTAREARDDAVRARLLAALDPRDVIARILTGRRAAPARPGGGRGGNVGAGESTSSWLGDVSLERLLDSCVSDPALVEEIEAFRKAFAATGRLDPAFQTFWETFLVAWRRVGGT